MSVTLRLRKMSHKGYTAYFDLYRKGQRRYEYPEVYLQEDYLHPLKDTDGCPLKDSRGNLRYPKPTEQDKLKLELLEKIRLQRELQLKNEEYGFVDSRIKKINLLEYIAEIYRDKKAPIYMSLLYQLKKVWVHRFPLDRWMRKQSKDFYITSQRKPSLAVIHSVLILPVSRRSSTKP